MYWSIQLYGFNIPVSLTDKTFDSWISNLGIPTKEKKKNLGFNPRLHQKPIDVLV